MNLTTWQAGLLCFCGLFCTFAAILAAIESRSSRRETLPPPDRSCERKSTEAVTH